MPYQLTDHTADIGIRVVSPTLAELFEETALAMYEQIAETDETFCILHFTLCISIQGDDLADLMVNWLREVLFLWNGNDMILKKAEIISISETMLKARLNTVPYDPEKHIIINEIKAVTYHEIYVRQVKEGWETSVIFDV